MVGRVENVSCLSISPSNQPAHCFKNSVRGKKARSKNPNWRWISGWASSAFLHDLDETLTKERDLGTPNSGQYEKEQTSGQRKGLVKS